MECYDEKIYYLCRNSHSHGVSCTGVDAEKGQVIGGDGGVYDGASPEVQENLVANAKRTGKKGPFWR